MIENQNHKKIKSYFVAFLCCAAAVFFDQWTKRLAVSYLKGKRPFVLIPGVFELNYLENRGASFGILQGWQSTLIVATAFLIPVIIFIYGRIPDGKRFLWLKICSVMVCAGAAGNLIDRITWKYVVDFFYFRLIDFPIFNVADCYVTGSYILFAFLVIFYYNEEDMKQFSFSRKQNASDAEEKGLR